VRVEQTNNHSVAVAALIGVGATLGFLVLLLTCWTLLHCLGYSGHPWRSRKKTVGDVETGEGDEGDQLQPVLPPCPTIPVRSPSLPSQGFLFREGEEGRGEDKILSSLFLVKHSFRGSAVWSGISSACSPVRRLSFRWPSRSPASTEPANVTRRLSSLVSDEVFLPSEKIFGTYTKPKAQSTVEESETYCTIPPITTS